MLAEWHLTPEWVLDNWTNEELTLMVEKLAQRKQRELEAIKGKSKGEVNRVSDQELFAQTGGIIKVMKVTKDGN